jgi:hypothetical protein
LSLFGFPLAFCGFAAIIKSNHLLLVARGATLMADLQATTLPRAPVRRRWRRYVIIVLVLAITLPTLCWVGVHGYQRYTAQRTLDAAIAEVGRKDPNWRLEDLEAARKVIPNDQNPAQLVMDIKDHMPRPWQPVLPSPKPERQLRPTQLEELRSQLQPLEEALTKAAGLETCADGRFPSAPMKDPLAASKNCDDAPAVAQLLRMQAMVKAQDGDADGALRATQCIAGTVRAVGDERRMTAQMVVRLRCRFELCWCLERVLAQGEPSEAPLAKLQKALEEEAAVPAAVYAAEGERAGYHQLALAAEAGDIDLSKICLQITHASNPWVEYLFTPWTTTQARLAHAHMLELMTDLVEITRLPPEEQGPPTAELNSDWNLEVGHYRFFPELDKRVKGLPFVFRQSLARLRCAIVAIAAERYLLTNKRWPEKLADLVPAQLAQLPTDPFNGQSLQYDRLKDGVKISSVGRDSEDRDSQPASEDIMKHRRHAAELARLEMRLWDLPQRRQPPPEKEVEVSD